MQQLSGYKTQYQIVKQGTGDIDVKPGMMVTVHATGFVKETDKKFWSTKDAGQEVCLCTLL